MKALDEMNAGTEAANFFIHVPRLNGKGEILAVQSANVQLQTVQVLVDRVKERVARNPAEYGTVVHALEVRFEDDSELIEVGGESSLALLNYQRPPSGDIRKDAKAWPQVWAIMDEPSGEGQGEAPYGDHTNHASPTGHANGSSPSHPLRPGSPKQATGQGTSAPETPLRGPSERRGGQQANHPKSPIGSQGRQQESNRPGNGLGENEAPSQNQNPPVDTPARRSESGAQSAGLSREHVPAKHKDGEPDQNAARNSDARADGDAQNSQGRGDDLHQDLGERHRKKEEEQRSAEELEGHTAAGVKTAPKERGPVAGKKRKPDAGESSKGAKRQAVNKGAERKGAKTGQQATEAKENAKNEPQRPSKRQASVFGSTAAQGSYRAASRGKQAAASTSHDAGGNADAGINQAHYKKTVSKAGCSRQVSRMTTTSAKKGPRKTLLFRIENGNEVRKGTFKSIFKAVHAAQEGDIIEQWGETNESWFNLHKSVTLRGHPKHPAILSDKRCVCRVQADCGFKPFFEIQASASGLQLGPNVKIRCSTDKEEPRQAAAVYVWEGAQEIVLDHVTICGDSVQRNKKVKKATERPLGGFGLICGRNTEVKMRHSRVGRHERSGIQVRRGARLEVQDCDIYSNGDSGIWGFGNSDMVISNCTVQDNGQIGICIDGLPTSISGCLIQNNNLDGVSLKWPDKTKVAGSDQQMTKERICKEGHVVKRNYITGNNHGILVEEGVALRLDGNVYEGNRIAGAYFDGVRPEKQTDFPGQLEGYRSIIVRNNFNGGRPEDELVYSDKRRLPNVYIDS